MNQQTNNSSQVMEWLKEERIGYTKLLSTLEKQKGFVDEYDESNLLGTIQEKELIMGRLHETGRKIQEIVGTLPKNENNQLIENSQGIRYEIETLLIRILTLETYCENALEQMKSNLHGRVRSFRQNRTVLKGYGPSSLKRSSFSKNA